MSAGPEQIGVFPGLVADVNYKFKLKADALTGIYMNVATNTALQIDHTLQQVLQASRDGQAEADAANVQLAAAAESARLLAGAAVLAARTRPGCARMSRDDIRNAQWDDGDGREHGASPGRRPERK